MFGVRLLGEGAQWAQAEEIAVEICPARNDVLYLVNAIAKNPRVHPREPAPTLTERTSAGPHTLLD
jgi:hypothetical protein